MLKLKRQVLTRSEIRQADGPNPALVILALLALVGGGAAAAWEFLIRPNPHAPTSSAPRQPSADDYQQLSITKIEPYGITKFGRSGCVVNVLAAVRIGPLDLTFAPPEPPCAATDANTLRNYGWHITISRPEGLAYALDVLVPHALNRLLPGDA